MFEAKLAEGHILKKIIEAIKDIVNDVNLDVSPSGKLQNSYGCSGARANVEALNTLFAFWLIPAQS